MATSGMLRGRLLTFRKRSITSLKCNYSVLSVTACPSYSIPFLQYNNEFGRHGKHRMLHGKTLHNTTVTDYSTRTGLRLGSTASSSLGEVGIMKWKSPKYYRSISRDTPFQTLAEHMEDSSLYSFSHTESDDNGKSRGTSRLGSKFMVPGYAIAFSLFSKEKNELEDAHEKLKKVDALEMLLRRAKLSETKKEWQDADKYYHEALALLGSRIQDKTWDEKQVVEAQVYIFDHMANLALSRGRLNESEILYKETMKGLLSSGHSDDENAIVEISLKLAMIYAMQQRDKDAEAGYKFCMDTQEKKFQKMEKVDEDTLGLLGMCINSYSRFLIIHGRVGEADAALKKTIGIAEKVFPEDHPQIAVLYSDLATTATMLKHLDAAKSYIEKAIAIADKTKSSDMATFWCNKGLICSERGELSEAEAACIKAVRLAKKNNDKDMETEASECLEEIRNKQKK